MSARARPRCCAPARDSSPIARRDRRDRRRAAGADRGRDRSASRSLQGNDKNRDLTAAEEDARYLPRSHFDLAGGITDPVDLIVFPESSHGRGPAAPIRVLGDQLVATRDRARRVGARQRGHRRARRRDAVNLNVLYGPDGDARRAPTPSATSCRSASGCRSAASSRARIGALDRIPRDFAPGHEPGLFDIAGYKVATVICFESAFGYQVRPLVRDGAEVIVVSTNNRSYRRSANSAQHVAIGQMRAAETGRPVVQAAISGISALIDASGAVHAHTELFERTVLQGTVDATRGETLYVRFGDWVVAASLIAVVDPASSSASSGAAGAP